MRNDVVFTPCTIVRFMLDEMGYAGNILNKKILEPSFGDGVFLVEITERLICRCLHEGYTLEDIENMIKKCVFGFEIDRNLYNHAMDNMRMLLSRYHLYVDMSENLICGDAMELFHRFERQFDFVVGNPPYIRIHDMDESTRQQMKVFPFTEGTSDLYIVFYYIGLQCLNENGILCYITPNSYLKNTSQRLFREYVKDKVKFIYDFGSNKMFKDVDTYTCITCLKNHPDDFTYHSYSSLFSIQYTSHKTPQDGKPWLFVSGEDERFLQNIGQRQHTLSDMFYIQNGFATNKDSVYIGTYQDGLFNGHPIEKEVLHPVVKGSKCDTDTGKYILFPYDDMFPETYPLAFHYLEQHKEELFARDLDVSTKWYEFGRKQGFRQVGVKKVTFKHIIEKNAEKMQVRILPEDTYVYSGIYLAEKAASLDMAVSILSSPDFLHYCKIVGKDMANGYINVSAKQVAAYPVD